jgi:uncharacterized membrane protein
MPDVAVPGDRLDLLAALLAVALLSASSLNGPAAPRILLTAAFTFFVPGRAIVTNWPMMARWSEAAMSMVLSVAVLTLLATVTLWAHAWHPIGLFQVEAGLSIAGLAMGLNRRNRSRPAIPAERVARDH